MRVVLDTNLFIAAYFNPKSSSAKIIEQCMRKKHELVFSDSLRRETYSILRNVKAGREFMGRVRKLFANATKVKPTISLSVVKEDPDDDKFLECALEGKADYLITSDTHLLQLGEFAGTKICKPIRFLKSQRA